MKSETVPVVYKTGTGVPGVMGSLGKLNDDILYEIAQFLKPSPVLYTRLAMVNKDFYRVFTSDRLWSAFDVYHQRRGIYEHFRESIRGYEGLMALTCRGLAGSDCPLPETHGQKYFRFWYYAFNGFSSSNDFNHRETKMILDLDPSAFARLPEEYRDNKELASHACQKDVFNFAQVSERLARDEEFAKKCMKQSFPRMDTFDSFEKAISFCERVGPQLDTWLWEAAPSVYVQFWLAQRGTDVMLVHRHPTELVADRETALAALKGNAKYLSYLPGYHNDLEVVLASLSPPNACDAIYKLLRNHKDDALVAAVLDEHPFLLYAAPSHLRGSKETFYRFLDNLEYMTTVGNGRISWDTLNLRDWVPESFWADAEIAGRVADVIGDEYNFFLQIDTSIHANQALFGDYEWAKKRVEHRPPMWHYAHRELKYSGLLRHALDSMRLFTEAPGNLRFCNCRIGCEEVPAPLRSNYPILRELALNGCDLQDWAFMGETYEIIQAIVSVNLLAEHKFLRIYGMTSLDARWHNIMGRIRKDLLYEYVQDPANLATLKTLRFTLHWLWDSVATRDFAQTHLGTRPPKVSLVEFARLNEDVFYPTPVDSQKEYYMEIKYAVQLVRGNAHLYRNLSKELRGNQEVQKAIGRLRKHRCRFSLCIPSSCYGPRPLIRLEAAKS